MSSDVPIRLSGRVLVVEDSADGRSAISRILRCIGLETEVAKDGAVACRKAANAWESRRQFDLILMDMQMPTMDGFRATTLLRQRGYAVRIVALTANDEAREKCLDAGCDDYATKPIGFESLRDLVQRNLSLAVHPDGARAARAHRHGSSIRKVQLSCYLTPATLSSRVD